MAANAEKVLAANVEKILAEFGGPTLLAVHVEPYGPKILTPKTVGMWAQRGVIPGEWHLPIIYCAEDLRLSIKREDLWPRHYGRCAPFD